MRQDSEMTAKYAIVLAAGQGTRMKSKLYTNTLEPRLRLRLDNSIFSIRSLEPDT